MSVYKPKGSPWYHYDFQYKGVRFHGSAGTPKKSAAQQVEARIRNELAEHGAIGRKKEQMTLNAAADRYFEEVATFQPSADTTEFQLANLIRLIGKDMLLSQITNTEVTTFVARRRGEASRRSPKGAEEPILVSPASVNREVQLLRRVFRRAHKLWKVDVGEVPDWGDLMLTEPSERVRELRQGEEADLLKHLRPDFHPLVQFCLMTGVRLSNAIRLTWKQVDYEAQTITFRTKSKRPGGDVHSIPITQSLLVLLAGQRGHHPIYVFTYICARSRGKRRKGERYPFSQSGWRRPWKAALEAAGVEDFRFHDTRHTAATRTLRSSNNLKVVQRMLGHSDIATTARYAHAMMDDIRSAMETAQQVSRNSPEPENGSDGKQLKEKA